MIINRMWAMPNKNTFKIKPIAQLLDEEMAKFEYWLDPFSGGSNRASLTNDLNPDIHADSHIEALDFLKERQSAGADGVLYDPPYSFRQLTEVYKGIGKSADTKMSYFSQVKDEVTRVIKPGGKVICFGWNSMGLGKSRGFELLRVLLVPHGGSRNDTIVTVERKLVSSN